MKDNEVNSSPLSAKKHGLPKVSVKCRVDELLAVMDEYSVRGSRSESFYSSDSASEESSYHSDEEVSLPRQDDVEAPSTPYIENRILVRLPGTTKAYTPTESEFTDDLPLGEAHETIRVQRVEYKSSAWNGCLAVLSVIVLLFGGMVFYLVFRDG